MKIGLALILFAASAVAQPPTAACGPGDVSFKVTLEDKLQPPAPVPAGKAQVYLIHDAGSLGPGFTYPTTKFAIDGVWAGADHMDSWFSVSVEPGEHHVCASLQSSIVDDRVELAHFTAEAGKVYYFRTRLVLSGQVELLQLDLIDSDQGWYLVRSYPMSISKAKK